MSTLTASGRRVDSSKENKKNKLNIQRKYNSMESNEDIRNSFHAKHKPYERRMKNEKI